MKKNKKIKPFLPILFMTANTLSFVTMSFDGQWHVGIENDILVKSDGNYTNGLLLAWLSEPVETAKLDKSSTGNIKNISRLPSPLNWQQKLSFNIDDTKRMAWGLKLSQRMWTPENLAIEIPQPFDRPYAGLLAIESHTMTMSKQWVQKNWLSFGIIGPTSGAEYLQKKIHRLTDSAAPQGWQHQIENQITFQFAYEAEKLLFRKPLSSNWSWELSTFSYSNVGNFRTESNLGAMVRLGNNLENSFGQISSHFGQLGNLLANENHSSWMAYARTQVGYRFNDLSIEGSLPYDSLIAIEHNQRKIEFGLLWANKQFGILTSIHSYTKAYQSDASTWHAYGSINLIWSI